MKHIWQKILKRKVLLLKIVIPTVSLATILLGMVFLFPLSFPTTDQLPSLTEDHSAAIRINLFAEGLSHPTSMAFADNATLLVLEKDIGNIRKITDGLLEKEPVLQVNVDNTAERGLLGIAVLREEKRESKDSKAILSNDYMSSTAIRCCHHHYRHQYLHITIVLSIFILLKKVKIRKPLITISAVVIIAVA